MSDTTGINDVLHAISQEYDDIDSAKVNAYRDTFLRDEQTRGVLTDLLNQLFFHSMTVTTMEEALIQNHARLIMAKLGIWHPERVQEITDALLDEVHPVTPRGAGKENIDG